MTESFSVTLHNAFDPAPPAGWDAFVAALPDYWAWSMVNAMAVSRGRRSLAAVIRDGSIVHAVATVRLVGLRPSRLAVPIAGVADVDCLASASMPGIACAAPPGTELHARSVSALRQALRDSFGRRLWAVMFRQVSSEMLPEVLQWPAIVREGSPIAAFRNTFTDFESYLASLSKSRSRSLRRSLREIEADDSVTFAIGTAEQVGLSAEEVYPLNNLVVNRHHRRRWLRKRLMTPQVARAQLTLPNVLWLTYRDGAGELLAFANLWDHPVEFYGGSWGSREVADGGRRDLWFHFNAALARWCIENGRSGFVSGQGATAEKIRLGHELRRQWAVLVPHGFTRS